jgi:hypothetical protein
MVLYMSETTGQSPELVATSGIVSFSEEQQRILQATVVDEIAQVVRAQEVRQKVEGLIKLGEWDEVDVLKPNFISFLDGEETPHRPSLRHDAKVLDLKDLYMPVELGLHTTDPAIHERRLGNFHLNAVCMDTGKVIISSVVKKDDPSDLESENESWFSFIVDPNTVEQPVEMIYVPKDDQEVTYQALLPVLAGEQASPSLQVD